MSVALPVDGIGAFVGQPSVLVPGSATGPLAGTTLAVKDVFDVAGTVTGAGNPDFAAGRTPAPASSAAVEALVRAGATVVGKTVTDELAYSLAGTNVHHGTPANVAAPGRVPGGSSAGSAAAVAAGLVDLALGTDTGGSIRVPASYCGVYGWRPTHGAVDAAGVVPLAPSFDTVGLLARDSRLLHVAATALLAEGTGDAPEPARLVLVEDALAVLDPDLAEELRRSALQLDPAAEVVALPFDLEAAAGAFRALQGREAWTTHGPWIERTRPTFGPGIAARFDAASRVTDDQVAAAQAVRDEVTAGIRSLTAGGQVLVVPAAAGFALRLDADAATQDDRRARNLRLTSVAGLAGAAVVAAPMARRAGGLPFGMSFVGAPGSDLGLLRWVADRTGPTGPADPPTSPGTRAARR